MIRHNLYKLPDENIDSDVLRPQKYQMRSIVKIKLSALVYLRAIFYRRHFFHFLKTALKLSDARKTAYGRDLADFEFGVFFHNFTGAFDIFSHKIFDDPLSEALLKKFVHIHIADAHLLGNLFGRHPPARALRQIDCLFDV